MVRQTTFAILISMFAAIFALHPSDGFAQSKLPLCPSDQTQRWDNFFGTFTYANGDKYVGEWKENMQNGQGTYTFPDGRKYVGNFRNNMFAGKGTIYAQNGTVLESGIWNYDKLVLAGPDEQVAAVVSETSDRLAQSTLPPCPIVQTQRYDNCFGAHTYENGDKYVDRNCSPPL